MATSSSSYDHQSTVDTTSRFRSVKEAIATYGEQFLARKFAPSDHQKADFVREDFVMLPPLDHDGETLEGGQRVDLHHDGGDYDAGAYDDDGGGGVGKDFNGFANKLKKLEDELQETKFELKLLKKKESETEVAVASLNAELHKNMSKIARMEAIETTNMNKYTSKSPILDKESGGQESRFGEEEKASKIIEDRPTLDQVLSFGVCEGYFMNSNKVAKKKPIVPLITNIFLWKKSSRAKDKDDLAFLSPLYSSSTYLR